MARSSPSGAAASSEHTHLAAEPGVVAVEPATGSRGRRVEGWSPTAGPTGRAVRTTAFGRVAGALLGAQLALLLSLSAALYRAGALSIDFAAYDQAWWLLGHGRLDPFSSVLGIPFVTNNGELILWPASLLGRLWGSPFLLLVLQDLALVGTSALTLSWVWEALSAEERLSAGQRKAIAGTVLVALVLDPWCYQTARYDIHLEPFVALFALGAARALWRGRSAASLPWVVALALCGANGALALVGIGLGALLARRGTRLAGTAVLVVGAGWALVLSHLGWVGAGGSIFASRYGYLAHDTHGRVGLLAVLAGMVRHPTVPLRALAAKIPLVAELTIPVGLVGLVSPWGAGMALAVVVPSILTHGSFVSLYAIFQVWPAVPFVAFGSAVLLAAVVRRPGPGRLLAFALTVLAVGLSAAGLATLASVTVAGIRAQLPAGRAASRLAASLAPSTEVVGWNRVVGRLATRPELYSLDSLATTVPVRSDTVAFVLPGPMSYGAARLGPASARIAREAEQLGARRIPGTSPWIAFVWHPGPDVTAVQLAEFRPILTRTTGW